MSSPFEKGGLRGIFLKALVTGTTGFLGGALAHRLAQEGFEVTEFRRNLSFEEIKRLVDRQDYVFHCAALTKAYGRYQDFYDSNVLLTRSLIKACLGTKLRRFVHISTPSIYMTHKARLNIHEDDALPDKFINYYASTKKLAEDEVDSGSSQGLPCVTLRPQAIFGPGDKTLLPRLLKLASRGVYPVIGHEPVILDLTYIDNLVDACLLAAHRSRAIGLKINITNGEPCNLEELLRKLFALRGLVVKPVRISYGVAYAMAQSLESLWTMTARKTEPPLTRYGVCALGRSRTLDIRRAQEVLGYSPVIPVQQGLLRVASTQL